MCVTAGRSGHLIAGKIVQFPRLGASATTVGGDAFFPGISRLIGIATSPGRPRSSVKLRETGRGIDKIVAPVVDAAGGIIVLLQVPGGECAPGRGSAVTYGASTEGKEGTNARTTRPGASGWS